MLKTLLPTKCGEIHYETSSLCVLCVFCGLRSLYDDFKDHFEKEHFTDLKKAAQLEEPKTNFLLEDETITESIRFEDPLDWRSQDILLEESKLLPVTGANERENIVNDDSVTCNINFDHSMKVSDIQDERKADDNLNACASFEHHESDDSSNDSGDNDSKTETIDWNNSYRPGLLKHYKKRKYKPRNKTNTCSYCGRTFLRRYQLETHLNIHTGSKPHQCEICGRQFRAVTTLTRHLNTHEQRNIYGCKHCEKSFTHKAALLSHELRHFQKRNIPCDQCEKHFYTVNQCDTHKRRVHKKSDEKLPFACNMCPNTYRTASCLSTHKLRKHYKTAKYACEKCEKKFIDAQTLQEHQLIHIDGKSPDFEAQI